jgi:hypothetical protein
LTSRTGTLRPNSFVPSAEEIRAAFAGKSSADLAFFVRQCLERGAFDHALALGAALAPERVAEPGLRLALAVARFVSGERTEALGEVRDLLAVRPDDLNARYAEGEMLARSGDRRGALQALDRLVEAYPDYPGGQALLATLRMPGPPYREILREVHRVLAPRTYLEIGVETGGTLALATTAWRALGVDPADYPLEHALPAGARVVRQTSDAFFAEHDRAELFGDDAVELAFIDGMHLFEFALRDFANVEAWCAPTSTIVLHDCVPLSRVAALRERRTRFWVGDTWKLVWALSRHRPELELRTVLTPPSGLVFVRGLEPRSTLLRDRMPAILEQLSDLEYPYELERFPPELHVVPNDENGLREALGIR